MGSVGAANPTRSGLGSAVRPVARGGPRSASPPAPRWEHRSSGAATSPGGPRSPAGGCDTSVFLGERDQLHCSTFRPSRPRGGASVDGWVAIGPGGSSTAAPSPSTAITTSAIRALPNGPAAGALAATSTDPTIAVPSDDPRLDTLRERPEISPCSLSGKLDCTTFTEAVSITPTPRP